jgi:hypothetical protein
VNEDEVWADYAGSWLPGRVMARFQVFGRCRASVILRGSDEMIRVVTRWCDELRPLHRRVVIIADLIDLTKPQQDRS